MEGDNIQIQEVQVCLHVCLSLYPQCGGCNRNSRGQFFFLTLVLCIPHKNGNALLW